MRNIIFMILMFPLFACGNVNKIEYPKRAQSLNFTGFVDVLYDISIDGKVENVRITDANPRDVFDRSVMQQLGRWKFDKGEAKKNVPLRIVFENNNQLIY
ncbi:TonB family protein [Serratia marcescens]|uniref:TonB family protein n=1 Tax=Serratia marcescens TaxID=615 RepID=UPI001F14DFE9|nr:TonB family protein [Serratia marcescens]